MKILVCLKQVPALENKFSFTATPPGYEESGVIFKINSYDEFALEEALTIQNAFPESAVTVASLGQPRVCSAIRRGLEMGAKEGIHLLDPSVSKREPYQVAFMIANWARREDFNLIMTGIMSEDDQHAQTGPFLAAMLDIPYITAVVHTRLSPDHSVVFVKREREQGTQETVELPLPALLSIQSSHRSPRYPSLSNKLRARKSVIKTINAFEEEPPPCCAERLAIHSPDIRGEAVYITGSLEEKADHLLDILEKKQLL